MFHSTDSWSTPRLTIKYSFDCCWPEPLIRFLLARSSIVSELGFNVSFVWVRAIYCFLNQSCEPFLELPAHPSIDCPDILNYAESASKRNIKKRGTSVWRIFGNKLTSRKTTMVDVLKKKVPGVCGQTTSSVARNCEKDHEKAVFDIIQIVHKL